MNSLPGTKRLRAGQLIKSKGYQLHLCTTTERIILSHVLTTANRNDAAVAPELFASLGQWGIEFVLGDAAYDSEKVRQTESYSFLPSTAVIARNGKCLWPGFSCSFANEWLFGFHRKIKRVFNDLKSDGLEQPRWYGFHRYVLHVLCCILMHHFEFLL
nr:transposase [Parageobacillus thermoglucosidasius]